MLELIYHTHELHVATCDPMSKIQILFMNSQYSIGFCLNDILLFLDEFFAMIIFLASSY